MNYLIHSRPYTILHPLKEELNLLPNTNYLFNLEYLSTLTINGDKSSEFLQGQLSCDMRLVTSQQMRQGVMCNLKGRILAALDVIALSHQQIVLVLPKDIAADIQAKLAKPAQFSRIQINPLPMKIYGLFVQSKTDLNSVGFPLPTHQYEVSHNNDVYCYKIDTSLYMLMSQSDGMDSLFESCIKQDQKRGSLAWHALQLQYHRAEIYPESQGLFLPHRLNMHQTGYLSFEKGCYKGQEIIARMHYRSTQKYTLTGFKVQTILPLYAGLTLYSEDGKTAIGELIDYCPIGDNQFYIVASILINSQINCFSIADQGDHKIVMLSTISK